MEEVGCAEVPTIQETIMVAEQQDSGMWVNKNTMNLRVQVK